MSEFTVRLEALELIRQLSARQEEHLTAIRSYLEQHTSLEEVGGVVMQCLGPQYAEGRRIALEGFDQGREIARAVADAADASRQAYEAADRRSVDRMRRLGADVDVDVPGYRNGLADATLPLAGAAPGEAGADDDAARRLAQWERVTPDPLQRPADTAWDMAKSHADRVRPRKTTELDVLDVKPGDLIRKPLERFVWDRLDRWFNPDGATSTLQERFGQRQQARFGSAYDSGVMATPAGSLTRETPWTQARTGVRAFQAADEVVSLYGSARSAWNELGEATEAADRRDRLADVATRDNTDNHRWAD